MYKKSQVVLALSKNMNADFYSGIWDFSGIHGGAIEIAWASYSNSGTAATLTLEASATGVNYCTYNSDSVYTLSGASATGCKIFEVTPLAQVSYFRVHYTANAASAGTITMVAVQKVLLDQGIPGGVG